MTPNNCPWPLVPLGELTENFDGVRVPVREADRKPGPYPYYGASGIVDRVDGYLFDGEYLLIAEDGENLRTRKTPVAFIARGKFWVNNHAHIVQGNARADTQYLMYALSQADIAAYLTGSTMPKLTQDNLNRIPIPTPSKPEQEAIAGIHGSLDDKIELNRRMNATLEAMARTLFRSWFVDFDPVRAKAEGRTPRGMDAETAKLFPEAFEDSSLGGIPQGWRIGKLSDACSVSRDGIDPGEFPNEVFDHYSIPAFDEGRVAKAEVGEQIKSNKFVVPSDAVLLSKLNPRIERVWFPDVDPQRRSVCSTEFVVLRPKPPFSREWVVGQIRATPFQEVLVSLVTGTSGSHQRVKAESVMNVDITIPAPGVVSKFGEMLSPMESRIAANIRETARLAAVRDALLPKLLSGEVRLVEPASRLVEKA